MVLIKLGDGRKGFPMVVGINPETKILAIGDLVLLTNSVGNMINVGRDNYVISHESKIGAKIRKSQGGFW
jgi:hypothetical protein